MIDVILQTMNAFLFDDFMLWIWGPWSLLAILNGYLIADGFDSVEEALGFFGTIALIGGGLSLFTRESFLEGAFGWVKSTIMGFVLIPAVPCIYLLPVGWRIGTGVGLEWLGAVAVTAFVVLSLGLSLLFLWVFAIRNLRRSISAFPASVMGAFVFALPPAAALAIGG
ncbi:MAG: hypothetical protein ACPGQS_01005 [Bradymonadia bacterium]